MVKTNNKYDSIIKLINIKFNYLYKIKQRLLYCFIEKLNAYKTKKIKKLDMYIM